MALFAFIGFIVFLLALLLVAVVVSARFQRLTHEASFLRGQVPQPLPDGFYKGTSYLFFGVGVPWKGKQFLAGEQKGINLFTPTGQRVLGLFTPHYKKFQKQNNGTVLAYELVMSVGPSIKNPHQQVLKLDYNFDENPSLVRTVLDEVVEVDPGRLLGKVHIQILPGLFWTIGYFALQKATEEQSTTVPMSAAEPVASDPAATPSVPAEASVPPIPPVQTLPVVAIATPSPVTPISEPSSAPVPASPPLTPPPPAM